MYTQSGTGSYDFTVSRLDKGQEFIIEGNYVVMLDDEGKAHQFTIMKVTETETEKVVECEDASLQLLNKQRRAWIKPATAQPITYYANKALQGTGWEIGYNEVPNLNRTLEWTGSDSSLNRLFSIATQFDNAELDFHVELDRTRVIKRVVDIKKKLGSERDDIQLVYGDTVTGIQKTVSILNFRTALYGVGALVENTKENEPEKHYDFSAIEYDDGDFFSPKGDPMLYARKANERFNLGKEYIDEDYSFDTKDANELLKHTLTHLKEVSEPEINYEVELADFDGLHLTRGDTVRIIDHGYNPELLITARVIELDKSYTDPSQDKAIFGNFMSLVSGIDPMLLKIQQQLRQLPKARTPYPWVRYADDDKGTGMSALPAGKSYMATVWNYETAVPSDNPIDYAEKWVLIKGTDGEDGSDGTPGKPGADGKTPYFHTAWADSADGTDGFYVGGGTNLYTDTKNFDNLALWWDSRFWTKTTDTYNGLAVIQTTERWNGLSQYVQVKKGDVLTYSVYAKYASGTGTSTIYWELNKQTEGSYSTATTNPYSNPVTLTDSWQRVSGTTVATSDGYLRPRIEQTPTTANTLQIAGIKVEKGSVATPWSPASEDPEYNSWLYGLTGNLSIPYSGTVPCNQLEQQFSIELTAKGAASSLSFKIDDTELTYSGDVVSGDVFIFTGFSYTKNGLSIVSKTNKAYFVLQPDKPNRITCNVPGTVRIVGFQNLYA